jgi:hypothetical protein
VTFFIPDPRPAIVAGAYLSAIALASLTVPAGPEQDDMRAVAHLTARPVVLAHARTAAWSCGDSPP